ncbi:MAG: type II secretion system F family protein [Aquificae bacterium]|nr:type II secretion system F family protein [Aquificota bacterium]
MPRYRYKAVNSYGVKKEGVLYAPNISQAYSQLEERGYTGIKLQQIQGFSPFSFKKVKETDLAVFTKQLGVMLGAGVGITDALDILSQQTENPTLANSIKQLRDEILSGASLSKAMAKQGKLFPPFLINTVKSAEEFGELDTALQRASQYYQKLAKIKRKIFLSLWYPSFILFVAIVVVISVVAFVVPIFAQIYSSMDSQLPLPTQLLIETSNLLRDTFPYILTVIVLLVIAFVYTNSTERGKEFIHSILLKLPVIGDLLLKTAIYRFSYTLATLLSGGVPILHSLEVASQVVGNTIVKKAVQRTKEQVEKGKELYQSLDTGIFPPMMVAMVRVGETTGKLDEMLSTISNFYEEEVDSKTERLLSLIEPVLIVIVGITVAVILIALYMPVFKIGSVLQ